LVDSGATVEAAAMNLIIRKASVRWQGGAKGGTRAVTTGNGVLKTARVTLGMPRRSESDTEPAELMAAAHASSFSLALSNELGLRGVAAGEIVTTATMTLERRPTGWAIINVHLNVAANLPKVTQGRFIDAAVRAKTNCLVSRLLRATISMHAKLQTATPRRANSPKASKLNRGSIGGAWTVGRKCF
jgi:osmotically inducible protein OsmC